MNLTETQLRMLDLKAKLQANFLTFIRFFYPILTGRDFGIDKPDGRIESHYVTMARFLTNVFDLNPEYQYAMINIPPGHGKSTMLAYFMAWCMAQYPDCQFPYISYGLEIATEITVQTRDIMQLKEYKEIFDVHIRRDFSGKEHFKTTRGGAIKAFGLEGPITGFNAGLKGVKRFSGAILLDDPHKINEVASDAYRERTKKNFSESATTRKRGKNVPTIVICQRGHASDLASEFIKGSDGHKWKILTLEGLDENDNALCEDVISAEELKLMRQYEPYKFWGQYQQKPTNPGGALYKREYFALLEKEPEMLCTFFTVDTAPTINKKNDKCAFSFWGVYKLLKISENNFMYGLHWINCREFQCEPKDIEENFLSFYAEALRYPVQPTFSLIEEENSGATIVSTLRSLRGMAIRGIKRGPRSHKTQRFLDAQPIIFRRLVSLPAFGHHTENCIKHMEDITANDTHAFDDIADTLADAVALVYIDKALALDNKMAEIQDEFLSQWASAQRRQESTINIANKRIL